MKRRVITALALLLLLFVAWSTIARRYHEKANAELGHLITLYRTISLSSDLVNDLKEVQLDLLAANTPWERDFDEIIEHGENLRATISGCHACHHEPEVVDTFRDLTNQVQRFEQELSFVLTATASSGTLDDLKSEATQLGDSLVADSVHLSLAFEADVADLALQVERTQSELDQWLLLTLVAALGLGSFVAIWLLRSVTRPVDQLVEATRSIRRGELGHQVEIADKSELGELADHFNRMSRWLERSYSRLESEMAERRRAEQRSRESESFLRSSFESLSDPFVIFDRDLRITRVNSPYTDLKGLDRTEVLGCRCGEVREHCSGPCQPCLVELAFAEGRPQSQERLVEMPAGEQRWIEVRTHPVRGEGGEVEHVVEHLQDITQRKKAEERLEQASLHDPLTGLPNRTLFMRYLEDAVDATRKDPAHCFAVLFLDLDRFKVINDTQGHDVGDALLMAIGSRVSGILREGTLFARMGGDEFVVLLDHLEDLEEAVILARRIREVVAEPMIWKGQEINTSVSIGVAPSTECFERPEDLVRFADVAMYRAKGHEPGQIAVYDDLLHREIVQGLSLESELRHALDHDELEVWYQPIMDLRSGSLTAFEALLRWRHPHLGVLTPSRFLPQAEESGLIHPIGLWTFERVLSRSKRWMAERQDACEDILFSVNLTILQLAHAHLVDDLSKLISKTGADAGNVMIELTEGSLEDARWNGDRALGELRDLGFKLCLDNFGAGNLALGHLRKIPFDVLKIDRSLLEEDGITAREILSSVLDLARRLGLRVVAEGVESREQMSLLADMGCQMVQGLVVSPPVPNSVVEQWLESGCEGTTMVVPESLN